MTNLCTKECEGKLPTLPKDYVQFAHKGGADLKQPLNEDERFELEMKSYDDSQSEIIVTTQTDNNNKPLDKPTDRKEFTLLKLVRKIWER